MSSRSCEHRYNHPNPPGWRHSEHRMSVEYILTMVICVHISSRDLLAVFVVCAGVSFAPEVSDLVWGLFEDILCNVLSHSQCGWFRAGLLFARGALLVQWVCKWRVLFTVRGRVLGSEVNLYAVPDGISRSFRNWRDNYARQLLTRSNIYIVRKREPNISLNTTENTCIV